MKRSKFVDVGASKQATAFEHGEHADARLVRSVDDAVGPQVSLAYLEKSVSGNDAASTCASSAFESSTHNFGGGGAVSAPGAKPRVCSSAVTCWTASSKPSLPKVLCSMSSNRSPISSSCVGESAFFHAGNTIVFSRAACSSYIRANESSTRAKGAATAVIGFWVATKM